MKKCLAILLTAILCFSSIPAFCEGGDFILRVETKEALQGERVEVNFILENNPGVLAMILVMDYDSSRLKLVEAKDGGILEGPVFGNDYSKVPFKFVWASAAHDDFDEDGVLATAVFEVYDDAPIGNANITIAHHAKNIINFDLEQVPMKVVNGGINIVTEKTEEISEVPFVDVKNTDWYYDSVNFVNDFGWMTGVSDSEFAPLSTLTRGMIVSILHRIEGTPECEEADFVDVPTDKWYSKGVAWAAKNQIVKGIGNGMFAPNDNLTREQLFTILYNYAKAKGIDVSCELSPGIIAECDDISSWALAATNWVDGKNMLAGDGETMILPKANATRATVAVMLKNFVQNM